MALFEKPALFYPGCVLKYKLARQLGLYKKILDKLKIGYIMLEKSFCCGNKLYDLGYEVETRKLARKNLNFFKKDNIEKIITSCPECYTIFSEVYKEMLPDWKVLVVDVLDVILNKLKNKKRIIKNMVFGVDAVLFSKRKNVVEILKSIGYNVVNLGNCLGSSGSLYLVDDKLAKQISEKQIRRAVEIGIKIIIVDSPDDYIHLREICKDKEVEIFEISEIIAKAIGVDDGE